MGTWYSRPCHGQAMTSSRMTHRGFQSLPASAASVPVAARPSHSGPVWCGHRLGSP